MAAGRVRNYSKGLETIKFNMAANSVLFKFSCKKPQLWSKNSRSLLIILRRFAAQNVASNVPGNTTDKRRERSDSRQTEGEHKLMYLCTDHVLIFEECSNFRLKLRKLRNVFSFLQNFILFVQQLLYSLTIMLATT